ncbi:hypothetical protein NHX12_011488, partial [Muraenolepis orangiensis]
CPSQAKEQVYAGGERPYPGPQRPYPAPRDPIPPPETLSRPPETLSRPQRPYPGPQRPYPGPQKLKHSTRATMREGVNRGGSAGHADPFLTDQQWAGLDAVAEPRTTQSGSSVIRHAC